MNCLYFRDISNNKLLPNDCEVNSNSSSEYEDSVETVQSNYMENDLHQKDDNFKELLEHFENGDFAPCVFRSYRDLAKAVELIDPPADHWSDGEGVLVPSHFFIFHFPLSHLRFFTFGFFVFSY